MALSTRHQVVVIGSAEDVKADVFSPDAYGAAEFPKLQAAIVDKAVAADVFAAALAANKDDAIKKYGVPGTTGPEISVKFTGVVGQGKSGIYSVTVPNMPGDVLDPITQTGPAINGTDIRDATGTVSFGQLRQPDRVLQRCRRAALNKEMKQQVLSKIDTANLTGKTVSVVGAFQLINPRGWLVTPVKLEVQ